MSKLKTQKENFFFEGVRRIQGLRTPLFTKKVKLNKLFGQKRTKEISRDLTEQKSRVTEHRTIFALSHGAIRVNK